MKFILLVILICWTIPSVGQVIDKVVFTYQKADEPPTKQGQPKYTIEFNLDSNHDFSAHSFSINKKRINLIDKAAIEKQKVEKIIDWLESNKNTFNQSELNFNLSTLRNSASKHQLNFEIPSDFIVRVDSFNFCQNHKIIKTLSTGGEFIQVLLQEQSELEHEFLFDSNDIGKGTFNLRDYLLMYQLFADKIPNEVPGNDFFSERRLTDILLVYQKTVECEGYYYKEFIDNNPNMTNKEKRMMTGWDFIEYLDHRNKKN